MNWAKDGQRLGFIRGNRAPVRPTGATSIRQLRQYTGLTSGPPGYRYPAAYAWMHGDVTWRNTVTRT